MGRIIALAFALLFGAWIAYIDQQPPEPQPVSAPATTFAADRAAMDVSLLAARPHPIGSPANAQVRNDLTRRMAELGLSPEVRAGVGIAPPGNPEQLTGGPVENVIGILPGRDPSKPALALMAHYDSVPASPGAADDIMGVAVALETVRAIKAQGVPDRDVMLVITDGEETGLLGANHFFQRDPLAKRIGMVINVEARGSAGRVNMFQTSPDNGELIDLFRRTAQRPVSSSLAVLIYEKMPNDTDLTETLRVKTPGLNYAIIGRQFDYHSPTSTPANLDRRSLQDVGAQVLAAANAMAFSRTLPKAAPSVVYSNVWRDLIVGYPAWFGWALIAVSAVLLIFSVRWARHAGAFPALDLLRGAGLLLFSGVGAVAVMQFMRRLTGVDFGFIEQRSLLAQTVAWEWAVMLTAMGVLLLAAAAAAQGRRWIVVVPLLAGLACSAFGGLDVVGAGAGVLAAVVGALAYGRPISRKGAWGGALALGLLLTVAAQIAAPAAAYLLAWPLLLGTILAAATNLGARRGVWAGLLVTLGATATVAWLGGVAHFAFQGMDLMPILGLPVIVVGLVLWPLAQPETGGRLGMGVAGIVLAIGLVLTLSIRSNDPWSVRYPQVSYVGYHIDQDTRKAWRFSSPSMSNAWTDGALRVDSAAPARTGHWAWSQPRLATPAPYIDMAPPAMTCTRSADGAMRLHTALPAGARTLQLQLRSSAPGQVTHLSGAPATLALPAGKWVRVRWQAAGAGPELTLRLAAKGRLDVRYLAASDAWPAQARALPPRPASVVAWDNSDSTFIAGTRAFAW